jgi:hypothetical protein
VRRFIGHVPLIRLPHGQPQLTLNPGSLRSIPYAEWHSFDSAFPYAESSYERTAPVFFEVAIGTGASATGAEDDLVETFSTRKDAGSRALATLYMSLLLATGARLPQPELSTAYLRMEGNVPGPVLAAIVLRIGPCRHELIVFGDQHSAIELNAENVGDVQDTMALVTARGDAIAGLMAALIRTTRPGFGMLNEALHLVGGLETLLVRRGEPLTATFARRYSVLVANRDARACERLGRVLYDLRSDLVHGRDVDTTGDAERAEFLKHSNRGLTCMIARRALRWFGTRADIELAEFHAALDAAFDDSEAFDALRPVLSNDLS